jgi:hypothetical protein
MNCTNIPRETGDMTCKVQVFAMVGGILLEQHLQVGCQIEDKVLRCAAFDERAGEFGIEKIRRLDPAAEQHYRERPVILPRGPKKALDLGMSGVDLLGPSARRRVVCLGRVDELARVNAKSAQGDLAQIEELKVFLEQERRTRPAFQSLGVDVLKSCAVRNVTKDALHQCTAGRGRGIQSWNHVS